MRKLLLITDNEANRVSYYHIMLLMASLPFDRFYSHIILISFTVHLLIFLKKEKLNAIFSMNNVVLQSVFFVTLIASFYSVYHQQAINELILRLPVLLFPMLFAINPLSISKYRSKLLMTFALVCTGTVIYLYIDALVAIRYYHLPYKTLFTAAFTSHNFSEPIDMHATFFSLQLVIAWVYLLTLLIKPQPTVLKILYLLCSFTLLCGLVQLGSKSILIILLILINLIIPYYLLKGKSRLKFMVAALTLSALTITLIFSVNTFKDRYLTSLKNDLSTAKSGQNIEPRMARWHVVSALISCKPVIGYGSGSEVPLLKDEFFNDKMYSSFIAGLNSHNQYLSFLIKSGTWGLLVYLITLVYGFRVAFKRRDVVFISFMLMITIVSLSENVLDADKGVMFYSFFYSFLLNKNSLKSLPQYTGEINTINTTALPVPDLA